MGKYNAYEKYQDSGVEWLGEIPEHWEVIPIKFLLSMPITDGPHETPELFDDGIPFISAEAIKNDKINFDKKRGYISIEEHQRFAKKYKPKYGDVYMVKSGATTGNVARVQTHEEFNIWSPLAALRPNQQKTKTDFLFYTIKSKPFFYSVEQSWSFGTQQNIGMGVIANIKITFPPLPEQQAIANFLDYKTKQLDALIAKKETLLEKLDEKRTAIISHAVTKGLDPNVPMKDSGIEWLGEIPEHWEVKNLRYACEFLNKRRIPLSSEERGAMSCKDYPYYGASGIIDYVENFIFDEPTILIAEDGANLLSRSTPLAFIAEGKYWVNNHAHILRPFFGEFKYWANLLCIIKYDCWITGSAQPKLTKDNLASIKLPCPPIIEQGEIRNYLEKKTSKIDQQKAKIQQAIDRLKEYRTALITNAVTGKIDVRQVSIP